MPALSEIREADAPPGIAAIYAALRAATGIPLVNLIWRHLATEPDALAWAWNAIGPAYASGAIARAATDLLAAVPAGPDAPLWDGLANDDRDAVHDLIAAYNRGNTQNLIGLAALVRWARSPAADAPSSGARRTLPPPAWSPAPPAALPPLPRRDTLAADLAARIDRLAARHRTARPGVTPSLYLHLAHVPEALAATERRLDGRVGTDAFQALVAAVMTDAATRAGVIAATLTTSDARPPAAALDPMLAVVDQFIAATIPEMIVVGAMLAGRSR